MNIWLAVDPGIKTGWALGDDKTGLLKCGSGEDFPWHEFMYAVIERPEIYTRSKANPNSIGTLLIRVGAYKERIAIYSRVRCEEVFPKDWKGDVPKKVHHLRGRSKMSSAERTLVDIACLAAPSYEEDIKDAVNLFLWRVGRLPK